MKRRASNLQTFLYKVTPPFKVEARHTLNPREMTLGFPDSNPSDFNELTRAREIVDMVQDYFNAEDIGVEYNEPMATGEDGGMPRDKGHVYTFVESQETGLEKSLDGRAFAWVAILLDKLYDRLKDATSIEEQIEKIQQLRTELRFGDIEEILTTSKPESAETPPVKEVTYTNRLDRDSLEKLIRDQLVEFNAMSPSKVDTAALPSQLAKTCESVCRKDEKQQKPGKPSRLYERLTEHVMLRLGNEGVDGKMNEYLGKAIAGAVYEHTKLKHVTAENARALR